MGGLIFGVLIVGILRYATQLLPEVLQPILVRRFYSLLS